MTVASAQPLDGILVIEFGRRLAVGAVGSLLGQLGATVVFIEADEARAAQGYEDKFSHRDLFAYGKHSFRWINERKDHELTSLFSTADVVLTSSDADGTSPPWEISKHTIVCDITAFGADDEADENRPVSDCLIQAMTGITDTTGEDAGPPVTVGAPVVEFSTALYAGSAVVAALRVRRQCGQAQRIDMALYDCAVNAMATFFPSHFGGGKPRRLGNRHSMAAPWNAYRASDGWVLLCSASEAHWRKICDVIGKPELGPDPRYATLSDRMARRDEVDAIVSAWAGTRGVTTCVAEMSAAGVACGPIVPVSELDEEENLRHRKMVRTVTSADGRAVRVPGNLFQNAKAANHSSTIPAPDSGRGAVSAALRATPDKKPPKLPLTGIRVVELGQYTTAPLVGRHLASLGAEVIKTEPFEGDAARQWAPHRDGLSFFFVMSNSGKRTIGVDLRSEDGVDFFRRLLVSADALIENMKPGSLARLGFSQSALAQLNPRLVYTAITGFGANSAYLERPAFDTVVQAMSGLMDVTRSRGMPLKSGISIADISGGQLGLLATLAGLEQRDRAGRAPCYDLSMQDVAAWYTQLSWNGRRPKSGSIRADNGRFVAVDERGNHIPVRTVAEVAGDARTASRGLIVFWPDAKGWPLLGSPLKLSETVPRVGPAIGKPQPVSEELERQLGLLNKGERASAKGAAG